MRRVAIAAAASLFLFVAGGVSAQLAVQDPLSRAEAYKRIVETDPGGHDRAEQFRQRMPLLPVAWDVDQRSWYAPYVETAFEQGLIELYDDGSFRPSDPISYGDALRIRARSLGLIAIAAASGSAVEELPAIAALLRSAAIAVPEGYADNDTVSRGDFLALLSQSSTASSTSSATIVAANGDAQDASPFQIAQNAPASLTAEQQQALQYASADGFAITMPTLGIADLHVSHPDDPTTHDGLLVPLSQGVGHLFSYPGNQSMVLLYGHSSSWPWDVSPYARIFRQINQLNIADRVYVTYNGFLYVYAVTTKETIPATDFSALRSDGDGEQLVLYTCWPPDDISERYLVRAAPVDVIPLR